MTESEFITIFQLADIAEINSLSLLDYGNSLDNYFNDNNRITFCKRYFKWFNYNKFDKNNNTYLKDFDKWFHEFF